jgi:hypothetical protein
MPYALAKEKSYAIQERKVKKKRELGEISGYS